MLTLHSHARSQSLRGFLKLISIPQEGPPSPGVNSMCVDSGDRILQVDTVQCPKDIMLVDTCLVVRMAVST